MCQYVQQSRGVDDIVVVDVVILRKILKLLR